MKELETKRVEKAMEVIQALINDRIGELENDIQDGYLDEKALSREDVKNHVYNEIIHNEILNVGKKHIKITDLRFLGEEKLKKIINVMVNLEKDLI